MNIKRFLCYALAAFMVLFTVQCGKKETVGKNDGNIVEGTNIEEPQADKNHKYIINGEATVADAQAAYDIEDYETAVEVVRKFAEQNNAEAQNLLGDCYANGNGVEQSYNEAIKLWKEAAEQGHAQAQCNLGIYYEKGNGVELSYNEAVKWYKKAAEQGLAQAQRNLGNCYYNGYGVEKSSIEAMELYTMAAIQGDALAQALLGLCYLEIESHNEAIKWFTLAAEQGNIWGQVFLGCYNFCGTEVEQSSTEAAKWFRLAAEQGNTGAQNFLGLFYEYGEGVEQSYTEAIQWYKLAAERGDVLAIRNLGNCYYNGYGVEQSDDESEIYYRKAMTWESDSTIMNELYVAAFLINKLLYTMEREKMSPTHVRIALESALTRKDSRMFWSFLNYYVNTFYVNEPSVKKLPVHYQEAVLLFLNLDRGKTVQVPQAFLDRFVSKSTERKMMDFMAQVSKHKGKSKAEMAPYFKDDFGDSYFYFYFFVRKIKVWLRSGE